MLSGLLLSPLTRTPAVSLRQFSLRVAAVPPDCREPKG